MSHFTFYADRPSENYNKADSWFLFSVLLLLGLGLFTLFVCSQSYAERVFNDSYYFVKRQGICALVGFVMFGFFGFTDMRILRKMTMIIVFGSIFLCLLTFIPVLSIEKNGARRWLKMPFNFSFQPSELVKFALILFLANYFEKQSEIENPEDKSVLNSVIGLIVFVGLIFLQKDFSTGAFILCIGILMFFVSGSKLKWLIPFLFIAIPAGLLMILMEQYRIERIIGFLRPDAVEFGATVNYQARAAKRAISSGGFWGAGIGNDLIRINSIPEIQADYIFAGWAEAMGFVGVIIYFILLMFFAYRGYKTALKATNRFSAYASFGCVSVIFLQSIVNCMVVCSLLPSTGIPLPFFSLGGSSIIVTLAMCGFIYNASRCESFNEEKFKNDEIDIESLTVL